MADSTDSAQSSVDLEHCGFWVAGPVGNGQLAMHNEHLATRCCSEVERLQAQLAETKAHWDAVEDDRVALLNEFSQCKREQREYRSKLINERNQARAQLAAQTAVVEAVKDHTHAEGTSMGCRLCAALASQSSGVPAVLRSGCWCPAGSYTKGDRHEPYCPEASTGKNEQ